ncbi:MAG TPA: sugar transferase [Opitutaceae bacterium]|nr:sugar transferase [Opitutaceae bacterium]
MTWHCNGLSDRPGDREESDTALPKWKRSLDIFCCLVALPLLGVCTLFIAVAMRITSPGPILFVQERVGYKGSKFRLYKFRTMRIGSDVTAHKELLTTLIHSSLPMQKMDAQRDPRLIPGGRILRASGIDELPQIINVLRGEMSLVGPRPCIPYEYEQYSPRQRQRFLSVPGLTGLWQVSGKNRTTFERMILLDIEYAKCKSLWLDIKIIALTPAVILLQLAETRMFSAHPSSKRPSATDSHVIDIPALGTQEATTIDIPQTHHSKQSIIPIP